MATFYLPSSGGYSTTNQYIKYRIKIVEGTFDATKRVIPCTISVQFYRTNNYTTNRNGTCYCEINGEDYSNTFTSTSKSISYNSYTTLFSKTVNIPVDASGNASVEVYAYWKTKTSSSGGSAYSSSSQGGTVALTKRAALTYTVSYNANGGSGAPSAQTKAHGKTLTLSTVKPTRNGYDFMGWGTYSTDTAVNYASGGSYESNASITLYAIWRKAIALIYGSNGGTGKPTDETKYVYNNATVSATFTVSSVESTRTGYVFLGWSLNSKATTADYVGGDEITLTVTDTLYAVWKKASYALTINPNGGTWGGTTGNSAKTQEYGTTLEVGEPVWTGHEFTGWGLSGYGSLSGTTYKFGAGNGSLTANWDTNDYPVIFDAGTNGGTVNGKTIVTEIVEYGSYASMPMADRKNYVFKGWFTAPAGGELVTTLRVTGTTTVYAQFEIDASVFVKVNGEWKSGVAFANGKDKGYTKVNDDGTWKDGFC